MLKPYLAKVINRQDLTLAEAKAAMDIIMRGHASFAQIGGYLVALRMKGETVPEVTGSAQAMRAVVNRVTPELNGEGLLDTAGTGGSGTHAFNISTAAAFIIAGAGRKVAKHGNRAASSKCGSADVLGELGVALTLSARQVAQCIDEIGIGFMFAPRFHPAMKHAVAPRRELGQRTIFNVLGPLTNPAGATHQIIGVFDKTLTHTLAEVLGQLGSRAAFVVHGHGGVDELTTSGPNTISHLKKGTVSTYQLDAVTELGLRRAAPADLVGGHPPENAARMRALLTGQDHTPLRDVILLNAAAALSLAHESGNLRIGLQEATASLESGAALAKMEALVETTQHLAA